MRDCSLSLLPLHWLQSASSLLFRRLMQQAVRRQEPFLGYPYLSRTEPAGPPCCELSTGLYVMGKHQTRNFLLPSAGRSLWCRLCTCAATRKAWTRKVPQPASCPACGAPAYEARAWLPIARAKGYSLLPDEGQPYPAGNRNAGYFRRNNEENAR